MRILLQTVTIFLFITAGFITLNHASQIPWDIMEYLWYAWLPCCAMASAFCYGITAKRSGGSIFLIAAIFAPILYFSSRFYLPFASHLANIPIIAVSVALTLPLEICGRNIKRKHKKSTCPN